jgi:PAS domain-containing protein
MAFYTDKAVMFRKAKKLTINEVAYHLDKARTTVSSWEHGKTIPTKTDIMALSQLLRIKISDISDLELIPEFNTEADIEEANYNSFDLSEESVKHLSNELSRLNIENNYLKNEVTRSDTIINSLDSIIYIKNRNRQLKRVNNSFLYSLNGHYTREDIIGSKEIDFLGRKEIEDIVALENKAFQFGVKIINEKIRIPGSNGRKFGLASIYPIRNIKKEVIEIAVSINDISVIVNSMSKLKQLEDCISNSNDIVWVGNHHPNLKKKFQYNYISENIKKIFNIEVNTLKQKPNSWIKYIHNKDKNRLKKWLSKNVYPKHIDLRIISKNFIKWFSLQVYKSNDVYYGTVSDITDRKIHEENIKVILSVLDNANDSICITKQENNNHKIIYLNSECESIYEVNRNNCINKTLSNLIKKLNIKDQKLFSKMLTTKYRTKNDSLKYMLSLPNNTKYIESHIFRKSINNSIYTGSISRDLTSINKLETEKEMLSYIINYSADIFWFGITGNFNEKFKDITFINDQFYKLTGYSKDKISNLAWSDIIDKKDMIKLIKIKEETPIYPQIFRYRIKCKNKSYISVEDLEFKGVFNGQKLHFGIIKICNM